MQRCYCCADEGVELRVRGDLGKYHDSVRMRDLRKINLVFVVVNSSKSGFHYNSVHFFQITDLQCV